MRTRTIGALGWVVLALSFATATLLVVPHAGDAQAARSTLRVDTFELPAPTDVVERSETTWPVTIVKSGRGAPTSLLVALHGRGEALRGPARGHLGWLRDYALEEAWAELERQHVPEAFRALATPIDVRRVARRIRGRALRSMAVVLVYTPEIGRDEVGGPRMTAFGRYVVDAVLPAVRSRLGVAIDADHTGIDGVSLGGLVALEVGLTRRDAFASVGALQPAVRERVPATAALMRDVPRCLRLASSDADPYLRATRELADALRPRAPALSMIEYRGPHAYSWNRDVGSVELVSFHARCFADAIAATSTTPTP